MAVNNYFDHVSQRNEQDLYHDLAEEMIQLSGVDVQYIRVENLRAENYDPVFGENRFEKLAGAVTIEMYMKDFEQPLGGDDLYSKFGFTQSHTCTFVAGVRRFGAVMGMRPREGDYIYIPEWDYLGPDDIFRITKVDFVDAQWKALGSPVYYFIKCERAKFSHQEVNTGISDLDEEAVRKEMMDRNDDTDPLEELGKAFIDFSEDNPFGTA
nr:MAG TPA: neck protein [Caudoviricetes sp.]